MVKEPRIEVIVKMKKKSGKGSGRPGGGGDWGTGGNDAEYWLFFKVGA